MRRSPSSISRSDELAAGSCCNALDRFSRVAVLDEMAATEDGEEADATALQGLHAKAFIAETGWDTAITVGSGNATRPALLSGNNVELFATLTGKRSRVGSVEEILGEKGFGRLTRPFVPTNWPPSIQPGVPPRRGLMRPAASICRSGLRLRCERTQSADGGGVLWRVWLIPADSAPARRHRRLARLAHHARRRPWPGRA